MTTVEGWRVTSVGEVAEVVSGPAFTSKDFGNPGDGTPLLRGENIEPGALRWTKTRTWPDALLLGCEHLLVQPGDLILGMDRPVVSAGLKLAEVTAGDTPALLVQRVARIRGVRVEQAYLKYALSAPSFEHHLSQHFVGTQLPHVSLKTIRDFRLAVPSVLEQRRIVEILEDHQSRLDAAGSDLARAARRLELFLSAGIESAFHGSGGPLRQMGDVARWGSGGTPKAGVADFYSGGAIPWLNSGDLADGLVGDVPLKITEAGLASSSAKWVPPGSVLVAMYGATIGRLGIAGASLTTNQAIAFATPGPELLAGYLFWFLRSQRPHLVAAGKGGAQPNISQTILKRWELPVPSLDEQEAAIRHADAIAAGTRRMRTQLEEAQSKGRNLRRGLLAAAFSGQLTSPTNGYQIEEMADV